MTYSLKLEVDGYDLAILLWLTQKRVNHLATTTAIVPGRHEYMLGSLDLLAKLINELPLGPNDQRTLKLNLSQDALSELLRALRAETDDQRDLARRSRDPYFEKSLYVSTVRRLLNDVTIHLEAVKAARKTSED